MSILRPVRTLPALAVAALGALAVLVGGCRESAEDAGAESPPFTAQHAEDFPASTTDAAGTIWLATTQRPVPGRHVGIDIVVAGRRQEVAALAPEGLTGIGRPAVAPLERGCVVTFAVEIERRWRIAVAFVEPGGRGDAPEFAAALRVLDFGDAAVNRAPVVAVVGDRAWLVWESDVDGPRGVYVTSATREGWDGPPRRLSSPEHASRNPAVVARTDPERLFVAWDSFRNAGVDLFGAEGTGDDWTPEVRLTSGERIDRHVALAAVGDEVWLAWDATAFVTHRVNAAFERRVHVARTRGIAGAVNAGAVNAAVNGDVLLETTANAGRVSESSLRPMRPWIGVDPAGAVWLTARSARRLAKHGFHTLVWNTTADGWSEARTLRGERGRSHPAPIAWGPGAAGEPALGWAAVQRDDLPGDWLEDDGVHPDWHSQVDVLAVRPPPSPSAPPAGASAAAHTEAPFHPAPTDFRLADHLRRMSTGLARQRVEVGGRALTLHWGDFHEHSDMSVCERTRNPAVPDLWANQRDIEGLDFTAITDHGFNLDRPQWQYAGEQVRAFHEPGRFVTFLAEEWTSDLKPDGKLTGPARYGHRNLIFRDPFHPRFYDAHDGDISPEQLWREFGDAEVLTIPHQLADVGNVPTDWDYHDDVRQPVAEIFQVRGSYEALGAPLQAGNAMQTGGHYLQDAWARGLTIGVIASPDHGGGRGKAGVWCDELSRDAIFRAFRARHTFGTTGPKIAVWLGTDAAMMGDVVERSDSAPIELRLRVVTDHALEKVVLLRNNEIVHEIPTTGVASDSTWTDEAPPDEPRLWYYLRVHRADGHLAWSSPIWFDRPSPR